MYRLLLILALGLCACVDPADPPAATSRESVVPDIAPGELEIDRPDDSNSAGSRDEPAVGEAAADGVDSGPTSVYTDLDLDACVVLDVFEEGEGVALRCDGFEGTDLFVTEGDLRFDVDVGVPNDHWTSAGPFNTLGDTVEWRLLDGAPVAVILRYHLDNGDGLTRSDLAVISVGTAQAPGCLIGWVEPNEAPSQNVAARRLADGGGAAADCA